MECVRSTEGHHRTVGDPPQRTLSFHPGWLQYLVYCSGECGGENGETKEQGEVGLAVKTSITRAARSPEFISDRFLKVTLELRGRVKAVMFSVAYAPTETQNASNKHAFWTTLDRAVEEIPKYEQLFVLMDANARTGRREKEWWGTRITKISVPTVEIPVKTRNNCCPSPTTMTLRLRTRFLAHPRVAYHILSTGEAKNVSTTC